MRPTSSHCELNRKPFPRGGNRTAILFVHGLTGHYQETWGDFPQLVFQDSDLGHCDTLFWGYPSPPSPLSIPFLTPKVPDLDLVSRTLRSSLGDSAFGAPYSDLVIVAHSMGGLIVLRALLDSLALGSGLPERVRHLLLYACPVKGVQLAKLAKANPQVRDLCEGPFVDRICEEWREAQAKGRLPFPVTPVLGIQDAIVPPASAQGFWPVASEVIPGSHTSLCKPESLDHPAFTTLKKAVQASTIPHLIRPSLESAPTLRDVQLRLVQEARKILYTTGSRSHDRTYLEAIEQALAKRPKLAHQRVLFGPARTPQLKDHLLRLLALRESRSQEDGAIHIGLYDNPSRQAEVSICGNENRCLLVLPSPMGIGHYSTGIVFTDSSFVSGYQALVSSLFEASLKIQAAAGLRSPAVVESPGWPAGVGPLPVGSRIPPGVVLSPQASLPS